MMVLGAKIEHGAASDSPNWFSILGSIVILGVVASLLVGALMARDRRAHAAVDGHNNQKQPGSWGAGIGAAVGSFLVFIIVCIVFPKIAPLTTHAFGTIAYLVVASLVIAGAFAPRHVLESPKVAALIGTPNPKVARVLCIVAAIIFCVIIPCFFYWLAH